MSAMLSYLVDLSERKTSALVRVGDVGIIVVEVVEGSIASSGVRGHCVASVSCVVRLLGRLTSRQGGR